MLSENLAGVSKGIFFLVVICLAVDSLGDEVGPSLRDKMQQQFATSKEGVCKNKTTSIAVRDIIKLKNKSIKDESKHILIGIEGESVFLEKIIGDGSNKSTEKVVFNLDAELSEKYNEDDMDIDLELVILENLGYAVLWRETYKHKQYRLGVNVFKNGSLEYFCDGMGGVSKSH